MNSRRVQSSISRLQKDVDNCEMFVSKNMKSKIDKSKSNTQKCDQNVDSCVGSRERSVMTYVTSPQSRSPVLSTGKPNSHKTTTNPIGSRLLCKEVFENNNATVEVTVKTKTSSTDRSRKRPRSNTGLSVPETDTTSKCSTKKYPSAQFGPPAPSKVNRKGHTLKKMQMHPKNKQLSWAHILKDSNIPCVVHASKASIDSHSKKYSQSSKNSCKDLYSENSVKSTETSENSCSSDQDSVCYMDRSVQCHLLKNKANVKKEKNKGLPTTSASSKLSAAGTTDGYSAFSMFNPVSTLNFLIKELHGKIQKCDPDNNMQRIMLDIEQALNRIPLDSSIQEVKENLDDMPSRDVNVIKNPIQSGFVPLKPAKPSKTKPIVVPKAKLLEPETELQQLLKPTEPITPPTKEPSHTQILRERLEGKSSQLELDLKQLDLKYEHQRKENKSLVEQMRSLTEQFDIVSSREKDYLTTINYLRSNLETMTKRSEDQAKSISELSSNIAQLKQDNKMLLQFRETQEVFSKRLKESSENEEKMHAQLQIMKLEREKFDVLLAAKNQELEKFKQELRDIQGFVSNQLSNLKSSTFNNKGKEILNEAFDAGKRTVDSDLESVTLFFEKTTVDAGRGNGKQPVCSSPTSSGLSSSGVDSSWQKISRISSSTEKDVKKKPSPEVLVLSPPHGRSFKESEDETDLIDNHKSFPIMKSGSPEFKSFLMESWSETMKLNSKNPVDSTEPKSCEDLKNELREFFDRIKKKASMRLDLALPSPPHFYSEMSEPGGMSQWSDVSDAESLQNAAAFLSFSNSKRNRKYVSTTDASNENMSET